MGNDRFPPGYIPPYGTQPAPDPGYPVDDPNGLGQSVYDFKSRVFPEDLGQEDSAHYMIININVPTRKNGTAVSALPTGDVMRNEFSKVDQLRFGKSNLPAAATQGEYMSPYRNTRRIKESIALHMPNGGLVFTEDNKYEEVSLTPLAGGIIGGVAEAAVKKFLPEKAGEAVINLASAVGSKITPLSQLSGYPINPRVEVLFSTRPQRQWMFEVFMLPRSESEAETVRQIIQTLRYYSAPELMLGGFFYIPPAEFDITFYQAGVENKHLPRINTCVLERIDIDYAPENTYSTFRNGQSVAVRMSLGFREIEILHKARVYQGF